MMLTGESNEPLKGGWEPNAELTPFLQKKNQPFARWLVAVHVFLPPGWAEEPADTQRSIVITPLDGGGPPM